MLSLTELPFHLASLVSLPARFSSTPGHPSFFSSSFSIAACWIDNSHPHAGKEFPFVPRGHSESFRSVTGRSFCPPWHSCVCRPASLSQAVFSPLFVRVALCCHMPPLSPSTPSSPLLLTRSLTSGSEALQI